MDNSYNLPIRLFIIILNLDKENLVLSCLKSLKSLKDNANILKSIIVVNNDYKKDSCEIVKKLFPEVILINNKKNLGWSGGNNVGIKYSLRGKADCILLLNNDVLVRKDFLERLLNILYSKNEIGIVGPKSYYSDKDKVIVDAGGKIKRHRFFGINKGNGEVDYGQFDKITSVDFISGAAMMVKSIVFKKIGLFDDLYFLYYEDVDFCFRARKAGFMAVFVPDSVIYHKSGATSKIGSALHNYYTTRNHYLFLERYAPWKEKIRELLRTPKTILEFSTSKSINKKKYSVLGVRDYFLRRFGERIYW